MSKYALENYEYIKGLHKQIAELEADKAELLEALVALELEEATYGGFKSNAKGVILSAIIELIAKHQQPAKEQGE